MTEFALAANPLPARLVLEDGSVFHGRSIGIPGTTLGELVFNTSATGYQEVLTDPSYKGQVVLMTYPEIGNYGVNLADYESGQIHVAGFVVKRLSPTTSSWRAEVSLQEFLEKSGIVGIEGIDTRAVTRRIRDKGAMKAGITTEPVSDEAFLAQVQSQPTLDEQDLVGRVTTPEPYTLRADTEAHGFDIPAMPAALTALAPGARLSRLVVVDFGIKQSMLENMLDCCDEIVVLPAHSTFADIQARQPQGVLLSNGPGDPTTLHHAIAMAKDLVASGIPTFGICLGHQILALASGARVTKMPFGHHGGNHPVMDLESGSITITSQNHGYAAEFDSFPTDTLKITHINLNDQTIEGFRHLNKPVSGVQFHPEASPGPHDARYLFQRFIEEAALFNTSAQPV